MELTLADVVNGAVGPFAGYCDGYGNPGASGVGYVSVLTLSTGKVLKKMDHVLEGIVSYDRAEANDAYVGQINMIAASSFNGLNGAVWGYHLAKSDAIATGTVKPLMVKKRHDGADVPIWPVTPLLDAGEKLFGSADARRYPLLPGAHVVCATKGRNGSGPTSVWCAIALAIAEDRERDSNCSSRTSAIASRLRIATTARPIWIISWKTSSKVSSCAARTRTCATRRCSSGTKRSGFPTDMWAVH